jgi:hypothetical protein
MVDVTLEECLATVGKELDLDTAARIVEIAKVEGKTFTLEYVPAGDIYYLKHDGAIVLETMCLEYALLAALAFNKLPDMIAGLAVDVKLDTSKGRAERKGRVVISNAFVWDSTEAFPGSLVANNDCLGLTVEAASHAELITAAREAIDSLFTKLDESGQLLDFLADIDVAFNWYDGDCSRNLIDFQVEIVGE